VLEAYGVSASVSFAGKGKTCRGKVLSEFFDFKKNDLTIEK
jgi:hypothetical protein